jgi:hypothetical protein
MAPSVQANTVLISLVALFVIVKFVTTAAKARLNKIVRAPAWAKHLWHIVPEPLLHSLTMKDWYGIRDMYAARTHMFCSDQAIDAAKPRVVLSCTTSPQRIKYLPIVLNLLDLGRISEIALNLPRRFGRNQQAYDSIPDYVTAYPKLRIHWYERDEGPIMKILNTIEREQPVDGETICISIDDDIAYPRTLVNTMISAQVALAGKAVVGAKGSVVRRYLHTGPNSRESKYMDEIWPAHADRTQPLANMQAVDMIEGYGTISYRAKHLDPAKLKKLSGCDKKCFTSDDIVLNIQL